MSGLKQIRWKEYVGDRAFYKKLIYIAVPVALQQLITVGINLMDTIMLSSMGDAQLSAASLAGQFVNMFQIFCMGISMGASVLTARYWGMQDIHSLRKTVTIMLRFASVFVLAFGGFTAIAPQLVMGLYTTDPEITKYGCEYLAYMVPCFLCIGFSLTCTGVLRTVKQVKIPLVCSIIAFFVNVFLTWMT